MDIVEKVFNSGVVGAGGAGFPTHIKLSNKADLLIANGVECEPMLSSDKVVMLLCAHEVIKGISLTMEACDAKKAIIALKDYAKEQKEALEKEVLSENLDIHIVGIPDFYPSGDEHVLVNFLTSKIIPEKGIPTNEKILVNNVNTLRNIYLASIDRPVTEVYVTLNGELENPGVYLVPLGLKIRDFLNLTGNSVEDNYSIIEGGPLTGRIVASLDETITKVSGGILVLPSSIPAVASKKASSKKSYNIGIICNQCRRCTDYCPRYLLGHEILPNEAMKYINFGIRNERALKSSVLCCDCGICDAFACDMGLSPRRYMKSLLSETSEEEKRDIGFFKPQKTKEFIDERRVPLKKLIKKLGIFKYTKPLEFINKRIEPELVSLNLQQGFGSPSRVSVKKGDKVFKDQLIAEAQGKIGSNLHSPFDGVVADVDSERVCIRVKE